MKTLALLGLVALSATALADRPLLCQSPDRMYEAHFQLEPVITVQILVDGASARFGNLRCRNATNPTTREVYQDCLSPHVADAGYHAILTRPHGSTTHSVSLSEVTFAGEEFLATLTCDY